MKSRGIRRTRPADREANTYVEYPLRRFVVAVVEELGRDVRVEKRVRLALELVQLSAGWALRRLAARALGEVGAERDEHVHDGRLLAEVAREVAHDLESAAEHGRLRGQPVRHALDERVHEDDALEAQLRRLREQPRVRKTC